MFLFVLVLILLFLLFGKSVVLRTVFLVIAIPFIVLCLGLLTTDPKKNQQSEPVSDLPTIFNNQGHIDGKMHCPQYSINCNIE